MEDHDTTAQEPEPELIMLPGAKLELIVKLAFFLAGYLDGDPREGVNEFQSAYGPVPQDVITEALGIFYEYAAWAKPSNTRKDTL